jgi:hypothetical protein
VSGDIVVLFLSVFLERNLVYDKPDGQEFQCYNLAGPREI